VARDTELVATTPPNEDESEIAIKALMRRARDGDHRAVIKLTEQHGLQSGSWLQMGTYAAEVEWHILSTQSDLTPVTRELLRRQLGEMRIELEGPEATELERMLVERVVVCWLQVQVAEMRFNLGGVSFRQAEHDQKVIDRAHKRHLSAIKALAVVRRLQLPEVQVNVSDTQVNIGRPVPIRDEERPRA
jgi:hypothetical protein